MSDRKPAADMDDDELFDELRAVVNNARENFHTYDRDRAREVGAECQRRGIIKTKESDNV